MAAMMDMALDDIIKTNQTYSSRGRGRGRGVRGMKSAPGAFRRVRTGFKTAPYKKERREDSLFNDDTVWEHDLYDGDQDEEVQEEELEDVEAPVRGIETGTKVSVANLEYSVNEENLKDVFERVGTVKKVIIRYDRSGRSEGTAEVTFARKADAVSAVKKYNGVSIDGKPVRLSIIGSNLPVGGGRGGVAARGGRSVVTGVPRGGKQQVGGIIVQSSVRGAPRKVRIGGNRGAMMGRGRGRRY